ncbi:MULTISPECIES: response regulator transcription factor [Marinovum]|uniref:response regulator transcription factor n=1 Tax=Marinovum TaxID=367771 RepID=UPI00237AC449|nr:response regulator [Marinovum sp. PR37]MDD9744228.1 response regulator [Marinovum sp. PR37]
MTGSTEGARILLVEDEQNIALALKFLIEKMGHQVTHIDDGHRALQEVAGLAPDLVLLDVTLPGASGYEICQHIRASRALDATRVLILTARGADIERRKALALGADGFMSKPFEMSELQARVAALLARPREA